MNETLNKILMSRRDLLKQMGTGFIAVTVSTAFGEMTPQEARAKRIAFRHFSDFEARTLEVFGDTLLPGSGQAGIAHFVDDQLGRENPMLLLKYLDYNGSYVEFYKMGLQSLNGFNAERFKKPFEEITEKQRVELVREISSKNPASWKGPPAPLFYFVVRNDAVDAFYGTPEGFEKLSYPVNLIRCRLFPFSIREC